jgi:ATP/maltotriose-dependent transcriptional regulator MalT
MPTPERPVRHGLPPVTSAALPPPGPLLLEREAAFATLSGALEGVRRTGVGTLLLVAGEAGVGKTVLLHRWCEGPAAGTRVLWGTCDALFTPRPLGPLLDIAEVTGGELRRVVEGDALPHEVAAALLRELARPGPTIVVIDDLHLADQATLDVLRLVGRRIAPVPALVLGSYRDEELGAAHPLRVVMGELATEPNVARMRVTPLSRQTVARLASDAGVDPELLFRLTDGNPFFVSEVLAGGGPVLPASVRDAVLARAARLSPRARRLLEAVAIIPGLAELWLLEAMVPDELPALEECASSGVLTLEHAGVAFRHELARLAVEESSPPFRRVGLHRAALAALGADGSTQDLARLAHHAEAARDAATVLRVAPAAAERAAQLGSHREAAAQLARALRFADSEETATRGHLLDRRAYECYVTGDFSEALQAAEQALAEYRALGDPLREGDALRSVSRLLRFMGRTAEARQRGREAVALLERQPPGRELAMAYANLSHVAFTAEDAAETMGWGGRARDLATALGDRETLVYALTNLGGHAYRAGQPDGQWQVEEAIRLAQDAGSDEQVGRGYLTLVWWATRNRWFELAERYLGTGLEYCTDRDLDLWRLFLLACRARIDLDRGRWSVAEATATLVLGDPRTWAVPRVFTMVTEALVRLRRGDRTGWTLLRQAWAQAEPSGELQRIGWVAAAVAEATWLGLGDPEAAAALSATTLELAVRCEAWWVAGELATWRQRLALPVEIPGSVRALLPEPWAAHLAADPGRAALTWDAMNCPYEAALARAEAADDARVLQAHDQLLALGAAPAAARAAHRLRSHGVRGLRRGPRATTRGNPAHLTSRELEVLALMCDGLANREIAERLVVSERTVHHHVSAVLGKLGVRTRAQAVGEAARRAIGPTASKDG